MADNKIAMNAGWDDAMLASELKALAVEDFDLGMLGFDEAEIEKLIPRDVAEDDPGPLIDRAAELQAKWGTDRGQVWKIGKHRLMCGDATSLEDVAVLLNGAKPFLMVTDPPYGVEHESAKGKVTNDDRWDWSSAYRLFPGAVAYVWHGERTAIDAGLSLRESGFEVRARLVWVKPSITMGRGHYHYQHEGVWYSVKLGEKSGWIGEHNQSSVWNIAREDESHPTVKPIECQARPIRNHSGDAYDPFMGSGSTMVAAEQLSRICYGMEIEPKYVAVCLERMAGLGLEPRLSS